MNVVEIAATFLTVFVLHMHIKYHLLTSDELVLHRLETPPTPKLNKYCDARQPIVFQAPLAGAESLKPGTTLTNKELASKHCNGSIYMAPYGTLVANHLVASPSDQIYKDHCYRHYVCALGNHAKVVLWPPRVAWLKSAPAKGAWKTIGCRASQYLFNFGVGGSRWRTSSRSTDDT